MCTVFRIRPRTYRDARNLRIVYFMLLVAFIVLMYYAKCVSFGQRILISTSVQRKSTTNEECYSQLRQLPLITSFDAFIIDADVLKGLQDNCQFTPTLPIQIMIHQNDTGKLTNDFASTFNVTYFVEGIDYWRTNDLAILKTTMVPVSNTSRLHVASDIAFFRKVLQSSKHVHCLALDMRRDTTHRRIKPDFVHKMAQMRNNLLDSDVFLFLAGGTLLGWYRECDIIPHTWDIDFGALSTEFSQSAEDHLWDLQDSASIRFYSRMGTLEDSREYRFVESSSHVMIDLFLVYPDGEHSMYTAGTSLMTHKRYKWTIPKITELCSATLYSRHFFVPCNPVRHIEAEYGERWMVDIPTDTFQWFKSHANVRAERRLTEAEFAQQYKEYPPRHRIKRSVS